MKYVDAVATKTFAASVRLVAVVGVGFVARARRVPLPLAVRALQRARVRRAVGAMFANLASLGHAQQAQNRRRTLEKVRRRFVRFDVVRAPLRLFVRVRVVVGVVGAGFAERLPQVARYVPQVVG